MCLSHPGARLARRASAEGSIILTRSQYTEPWPDQTINHIGITVDAGRDLSGVITDIRRRVAERYTLRIVPVITFLADAKALVRQVCRFTRGVTGVVLLVATVALLQSIVSGALERRRLLSLFRAIGASKRHLARMFVLQGTTLGGVGALLGLAAGVLMSLVWMWVHLRYLLDWVVPIEWLWATYVRVGMTALIWSCLASWVAARRLVRLPYAGDLVAE